MNAVLRALLLLAVVCAAAAPAHARDDKLMMPLAAAMEAPDAKRDLDGSIRFFFGSKATPAVLATLGEDVSNRKTNGFGKAATTSCNWAFLSAMIALQHRAKEVGANAVVHIVSFYQKEEFSSDTVFECHDGAIITGVALKGTFVKLADQ